jgi:hypothetical protein
MAYNYLCAPTFVEVPNSGLTPGTNVEVPYPGSTPTNAVPSAANTPEGANDNAPEFSASHLSTITVDSVHEESQCSAISADSVHETQPRLVHLDSGPTGTAPYDTPSLATGWCDVPPAANLRVCPEYTIGLGYETPPCVASVVVDESSRSTYSNNTNNPVERRLSA